MKILSFVGYHNSGKTTLIEEIIKSFENIYKIAYIKHDPKGHAVFDKENSDSARILSLNHQSAILSKDTFVLYQKPKTVDEAIAFFKDYDLIILEGFKYMAFPKVKVGDIKEPLENVVYEYDGDKEALKRFVETYVSGF
ncbi:MAG: molybdopterin-guanine dinucleotide biosynthesis protein B [Hydrogenobaculum sp.]